MKPSFLLVPVLLVGAFASCDFEQSGMQSAAIAESGQPKDSAPEKMQLAGQTVEPIVLMWQVQQTGPAGDFALLKKLGVNAVQASRLATWPAVDVQAYLDGAKSNGLRVFVYLGVFREGDGPDCHYADEALQFVRTYKVHPAIYAWHSIDEPAEHNISRECQRALYRTIKALDPVRPIMVSSNNNSQSKYDKYFAEDAFDILEMHKYVNPHPSLSQQLLLSVFAANRSRDYPVIMTLRAYNAPQNEKRQPLATDSLEEQYDFFVVKPGVTKNFGFYGWELAPNKGIKDDPELRRAFVALMGTVGKSRS